MSAFPIVTGYFRKMRGETQSHLVIADDERCYVIKALENPQHRRVLMNEWLAAHLLRAMDLPVPDVSAVQVTAEFLEKTPELAQERNARRYTYKPGIYFGSAYVGGIMPGITVDFLPTASFSRVANLDCFLGALIFDKWTCNADSRQAVFTADKTGRFKVVFIDNGLCFNAGSWQFSDAPLKGCYSNKTVYSAVRGLQDFQLWLARLNHIAADDITRGIESAPKAWFIGDEQELSLLVKRLIARRDQVTDLIQSLRSAKPSIFPAWSTAD